MLNKKNINISVKLGQTITGKINKPEIMNVSEQKGNIIKEIEVIE